MSGRTWWVCCWRSFASVQPGSWPSARCSYPPACQRWSNTFAFQCALPASQSQSSACKCTSAYRCGWPIGKKEETSSDQGERSWNHLRDSAEVKETGRRHAVQAQTSTATQAPTNAESASEVSNGRKTLMMTPARNRKFNTSHNFEPLRENIVFIVLNEKKEKT